MEQSGPKTSLPSFVHISWERRTMWAWAILPDLEDQHGLSLDWAQRAQFDGSPCQPFGIEIHPPDLQVYSIPPRSLSILRPSGYGFLPKFIEELFHGLLDDHPGFAYWHMFPNGLKISSMGLIVYVYVCVCVRDVRVHVCVYVCYWEVKMIVVLWFPPSKRTSRHVHQVGTNPTEVEVCSGTARPTWVRPGGPLFATKPHF